MVLQPPHPHNIISSGEYYKFIKLGEYEKAIAVAQKMILMNEGWKEVFSKELDLLYKSDREYFENLFAENEAKAREYLSNPSKHKKKHGY